MHTHLSRNYFCLPGYSINTHVPHGLLKGNLALLLLRMYSEMFFIIYLLDGRVECVCLSSSGFGDDALVPVDDKLCKIRGLISLAYLPLNHKGRPTGAQ